MSPSHIQIFLALSLTWLTCVNYLRAADELHTRFLSDVQPIIVKYCGDCHSSPEPKARLDLVAIESADSVENAFVSLQAALRAMEGKAMPPADQPQPTVQEVRQLRAWFDARYVDIAPRAAPLRPRRLSAHEMRQTMRSMFGFDLEVTITEAEETVSEKSMVMKLLPTDPPGASGFRNDTHRNPISSIAWNRYSELAELALEKKTQVSNSSNPTVQTDVRSEKKSDSMATELRTWFRRVYRRPMSEAEVDAIVQRVAQAEDPQAAAQFELKASLVSPRFLYRGLLATPLNSSPDKSPGNSTVTSLVPGEQPVDSYELAERLSYFLWADMPDDELFRAAADDSLQNEQVLKQQIERMLAAGQADNLATDMAAQWLSLDEINEVSDDVPIVAALKSQAIDFVRYLIQEDRPLVELVDSKVEFVNLFTAKFYGDDRKQLKKHRKPPGIEVQIVPNQRIELVATQDRGGILTMPGVLAMNRGAIIRGTWILERILGEPLPDPPANVGQVKPNPPGQQLTFRQRFEQHRAQASCAVCHDKIDPLGFVLEAYDREGKLITDAPPDTSGRLPSGETFANVKELKQILTTTQRHQLLTNITRQFLSYALCRRLEYYDHPTVKAIVDKLDRTEGHGTYRQLVREIVLSRPFRQANFAGAQP